MKFSSTKIIELGSCAFRQWRAASHCNKIHGYRLYAKFYFGCDNLDDKNWVTDFGCLSYFKKTLECQFDHTYCVSRDDPHMEWFIQAAEKGLLDLRVMEEGVGIEMTAQWCLKEANIFLNDEVSTKGRCYCYKVEVWEHEKNSAICEAELTSEERVKVLNREDVLGRIVRLFKRI